MFDHYGIRWSYEPAQLNGWWPDFRLKVGDQPLGVLVEAKPYLQADLFDVAKIEAAIAGTQYEGRDVLLLGDEPLGRDGYLQLGWCLRSGRIAEAYLAHHAGRAIPTCEGVDYLRRVGTDAPGDVEDEALAWDQLVLGEDAWKEWIETQNQTQMLPPWRAFVDNLTERIAALEALEPACVRQDVISLQLILKEALGDIAALKEQDESSSTKRKPVGKTESANGSPALLAWSDLPLDWNPIADPAQLVCPNCEKVHQAGDRIASVRSRRAVYCETCGTTIESALRAGTLVKSDLALGTKVLICRVERGVGQKDLAAHFGYTSQDWSAIERGLVPAPEWVKLVLSGWFQTGSLPAEEEIPERYRLSRARLLAEPIAKGPVEEE